MSDKEKATPSRTETAAKNLKGKAEEAGEAAKEKAEALKERARETARDAADKAAQFAEEQKARGGDQVTKVARALHKAAGELDDGSTSRRLFDQAADGLDDVAATIEGKNWSELAGEVAELGRRHPVVFFGGAALAGFALARFATASAPKPELMPREGLVEDPDPAEERDTPPATESKSAKNKSASPQPRRGGAR